MYVVVNVSAAGGGRGGRSPWSWSLWVALGHPVAVLGTKPWSSARAACAPSEPCLQPSFSFPAPQLCCRHLIVRLYSLAVKKEGYKLLYIFLRLP